MSTVPEQNGGTEAAIACALLQDAFPGQVLTADSGKVYEAARDLPWSQTCWLPARAYVQPSSTREVADVLAIIVKTQSKFAVRTWGHTPNPGFSSAEGDGIVVDLRGLDSIALNGDIVTVGAGCTWNQVYSFLEGHQLSATGGRDPAVGVSGFILGGGYPALPNLHGLGADGVKSFELVLADSTIINASAESNPELFRALKGGGANFGIVTNIAIQTYPLVKLQYAINLYNPADYANIINATAAVQSAMELDSNINLFTNFNPQFVAVGMMYAGWPENTPAAFDPFHKLDSLMTSVVPQTNGTVLSLTKAMAHPTAPGKRTIGSITTKLSSSLYLEIHTAWMDIVDRLQPGIVLHYTIQPLARSGVQAGEDQGHNIMGLEKIPQSWYVFTAEWPRNGDDAAAHQAVSDMVQRAKNIASDQGLLLDYLSMSFANSSQPVLRSYGKENIQRMQKVSARHDPTGVFQILQTDGFLLRGVESVF